MTLTQCFEKYETVIGPGLKNKEIEVVPQTLNARSTVITFQGKYLAGVENRYDQNVFEFAFEEWSRDKDSKLC